MIILYIVLAMNCWALNFAMMGAGDNADIPFAIAILAAFAIPITPALLIFYTIKSFSK